MSVRPSLILVPGVLCDAALWQPQYKHFSAFADVSIADVSQDESLSAMARRILARAPKRFSVAGLSMGGYVVLELWRQAPERITRLALLDSRAEPDDRVMRLRRKVMIETVRRGGFGTIIPDLMKDFVSDTHRERLADQVTAMALRVGEEAFIRQQLAVMARQDSRPDLKTISVPSLVLVGAEDSLTPPELSQAMAAQIPTAHYVEVPNCGHLSTLEQPEKVTQAVIDWLRVSA